MMGFKRRWVGLIILVAMATIALAPDLGSRLLPLLQNLSQGMISTSSASPTQAKIPASLFGMHIHQSEKTWPNVPFYSWRLWDAGTAWGDLEPQAGVWKFEPLDRAVALAAKKKVEILLTLGQTPRWASARPNDESAYGNPGWPAEPTNLKDWRNYIRTIATRYKGKIHHYEIWNEPDYKMFYTGSVGKMVELAREAYTILKQVDPTNVVLSPGATNGTPDFKWQKDFFRQGGGKYADVIAQHLYPQTAVPEDRAQYIERFTKILAGAGLSKKPLWNTETGWLKPVTFQSDRQAMAYVARTYLIDWAKGVQRLYWYAWDNRAAVSLYFIQSDRQTPTAIAKSYAQIQKWMVGARMDECKPQSDNTWICQLTRNGRSNWVVWNPDRELTFTVPKNWKIKKTQDLAGKTTNLPASQQIAIDFSPLLLSSTTTP
jgi:Glycosyl hydrolase family 10